MLDQLVASALVAAFAVATVSLQFAPSAWWASTVQGTLTLARLLRVVQYDDAVQSCGELARLENTTLAIRMDALSVLQAGRGAGGLIDAIRQ